MKRRTFFVLTAVTVLFIWGHSLVPLTSSAEESMSVMQVLQAVLDFFQIPVTLTDIFVRKLAHFAEHGAAGLLLGLYIYPRVLAAQDIRTKLELGVLPLVIGFFIGFIDETIQVFSGRGAMIQDVWLDFAGVCCGAAAAFAIRLVIARRSGKAGNVKSE